MAGNGRAQRIKESLSARVRHHLTDDLKTFDLDDLAHVIAAMLDAADDAWRLECDRRVEAERERLYNKVEGMARAMDESLIKAAGTEDWPKLAQLMTGLQRAADAIKQN